MAKGILFIVCGIGAILAGILGKDFQSADIITGVPYKQKVQRWKGRLVFFTVGLFFLVLGVKSLL